MSAYYNEIDPFVAQWLRNLIAVGHIAPGEVDERSILEVEPADLAGFDQCHFFAGIGVWSHSLRLAGWADDRPVWTGSCPCQPFSAAGKGDEFADERHLWPAWFKLIRERRPVAVFGEQVASKDALAWLDHVCADLEGEGYAIGAVDTCAAGFGAPHIRQRLYFVADNDQARRREFGRELSEDGNAQSRRDADRSCGARQLADADGGNSSAEGLQRSVEQRLFAEGGRVGDVGDATSRGRGERRDAALARNGGHPDGAIEPDGLGNTVDARLEGHGRHGGDRHEPGRLGADATRPVTAPSAANGFWDDAEWIACRDGKARPVEPGTFPLAHGATARVGRLRAYGNCIVAPQAAAFVEAYRQCNLTE